LYYNCNPFILQYQLTYVAGGMNRSSPSFGERAIQKNLTEKWKHLKNGLPGEVTTIFYCALGSATCRPVRRFGILDFKMKSEVTALIRGS